MVATPNPDTSSHGSHVTRAVTDGLARITVAAPQRRIDIALPQSVPVAELMSSLVRAAGESAADDAQQVGGWVLHRGDGSPIEQHLTLEDQQVRDGEILYMVGRFTEWPEVDYDDVVDAIATGSRKSTRPWSGSRTRLTGLVLGAIALALGLFWLLHSGPSWQAPGLMSLTLAVTLLFAAFGFSRSRPGDTGAAVTCATAGVLYAGAGGLLVLGGDQTFAEFDAWQFVLASGCLLVASILAIIVVAQQIQYFVATAWIGFVGLIACSLALADHIDTTDAAAIAVAIVTVFTAAFPILSIRLGKLPVPALPTTTDELLADEPQIPIERVHGTVRRSDEILTGLLMGSTGITLVGSLLLISSGRTSAMVYVALIAVTVLLRARLFPTARHRIPLLVAGSGALVLLVLPVSASMTPQERAMIVLPALVVLALALIAIGRYFSIRQPTPYLARVADIIDILTSLAIIPVMCLVIGLFGYVRGLWG